MLDQLLSSFDPKTLLLFLPVVLGLTIRWLASGRFDSVTVEIVFYAVVGLLGELILYTVYNKEPLAKYFGVRVTIALISLMVVLAVHRVFLEKTQGRIAKELREKSCGSPIESNCKKRHTVDSMIPVLNRSVALSFSGIFSLPFLRRGKRDARMEMAELSSDVTGDTFEQEKFAPEKWQQIMGLSVFFVCGTVSLVTVLFRF